MFPEYEWGPKILTHDRTNNEEINLLGWVFRLSIEIINVHINLSSTNLHRFCILTKTEFYNSHCPHTRKDVHILQIGKKSCNNMKKVFDDILLPGSPCDTFCRCLDSWVTKQGRSIKDFYINSNGFSITIECWNAINRKLPDGRGLTFESNDNFMLICCTLPAGGRGVSVSVRGLQCIVTTGDAGAAWLVLWCTPVLRSPHSPVSSHPHPGVSQQNRFSYCTLQLYTGQCRLVAEQAVIS